MEGIPLLITRDGSTGIEVFFLSARRDWERNGNRNVG